MQKNNTRKDTHIYDGGVQRGQTAVVHCGDHHQALQRHLVQFLLVLALGVQQKLLLFLLDALNQEGNTL